MALFPESLENLINALSALPGVGIKSAERLAFYLLSCPSDKAARLSEAITRARDKITRCHVCQNLSEDEVCSLCASETRDKTAVCVVQDPKGVIAIERSREYNGLYHVLHGALSPTAGVSPRDLTIEELLTRVSAEDSAIEEVILATNPDVEGETTANYITGLLKPSGVRVTRLARGIPVGGSLEFLDDRTLGRALEGRS
jgi:recombination protein RecR